MDHFTWQADIEDDVLLKVEGYANRLHPETGCYPTDAQCDAYEAKLKREALSEPTPPMAGAAMESIIDPNKPYHTFDASNKDLWIYVQPVAGGLTNIEMYSREECCVVRNATESDAAAAFQTFDSYMKWMA